MSVTATSAAQLFLQPSRRSLLQQQIIIRLGNNVLTIVPCIHRGRYAHCIKCTVCNKSVAKVSSALGEQSDMWTAIVTCYITKFY